MAQRYYRKVFQIKATDSPNVRAGLLYRKLGEEPQVIIPGVLPLHDYEKRRATWDEVRQQIGLDAEFPEDSSTKLFPPLWLDHSARVAEMRRNSSRGSRFYPAWPRFMGIDPGEGVADTVWTIIDRDGILEQKARKTPDTHVIPSDTIGYMQKHRIQPEDTLFDRGGGGKQHADTLRGLGLEVRSIGFGESPSIVPRAGQIPVDEKVENREERYSFLNMRAQMYWEARELLDPNRRDSKGELILPFAIGQEYAELRRQLSLLPLWYDHEGRIYLPPKQRKGEDKVAGAKRSSKVTIEQLIGNSPDEADSFVLAIHAMRHPVPSIEPRVIATL